MPEDATKRLTPADRTRAWRLARKAKGARELNVSLTPENSAWAARIVAAGDASSLAEIVNALMDAARTS